MYFIILFLTVIYSHEITQYYTQEEQEMIKDVIEFDLNYYPDNNFIEYYDNSYNKIQKDDYKFYNFALHPSDYQPSG